jgi:hypothetical protein
MIVDMVEAFSPGLHALLLEVDELGAKATPESCLTVPSDVAGLDLRRDSTTIGDRVFFL